MNKENMIAVRVWGDFACFTRPEMKVERVSYPLPTPSAARGILEAIYWEPQMFYLIDSIYVIKKGRWFNFRRNEVSKVVSISETLKWMASTKEIGYIEAGGGSADSVQRNMLALVDVEYIITAEVRTSKLYNPARNDKGKYLREVRERAAKGKCHYRPAFGCREFAANFDGVAPDAIETVLQERSHDIRGSTEWVAVWPDEDLGLMLYDVFDERQREAGFRWFGPEELTVATKQRQEKLASLPKKDQKKALQEPLVEYEGTLVTPMASFFHAKIDKARMDCHPERVNIIKALTKEGK
jgi:CRISPR-associated protein Cas5d